MITILAIPATAAEYSVNGADAGNFGKPTSVETSDVIGGTSENDNINRSKDSAYIPPPFGSPSSNTSGTGELMTPNIADENYESADNSSVVYPATETSASNTVSTAFTLPDGLYYSDGSLGTLKIPALGLTVKVYENESLESLAKGAGHFKSTSCWDGNVGLAGHNRGVANHFGQIHTLVSGDRIIYTTLLGTRTYEVFYVGKISETDYSRLQRSDENLITLITCVRDVPELRWVVQAREVN